MGISWNSDKIPSVKVHESKNNKCWREGRRALITLGQFIWFYLTQTENRSKYYEKKFLASKYSVIFADYFQLWSMTCWKLDILGKTKKTDELTHWKSCHQETYISWKWFPNGWIVWSKFFFVFLNYYCSNYFDYNFHFKGEKTTTSLFYH